MKERVFHAYSALHNDGQQVSREGESFHGSQYVDEFFGAWEKIDEYYSKNPKQELTFLEVGAYRGLWGIAFSIYCNVNAIEGKYVTVTDLIHDSHNINLLKSLNYNLSLGVQCALVNENTYNENIKDTVTSILPNYDIVLIDAGHLYDDVINDTNKFSDLANDILLFHDIRPKNPPEGGLVYVWPALQELGMTLDEEIVADEKRMGIGIKYINNA